MRMVTPAGDMEVEIFRVTTEKDQVVVVSKFGVWDSKIFLSPGEIARLIKLFLNSSLILFAFRLPFIILSRHFLRGSKRVKNG